MFGRVPLAWRNVLAEPRHLVASAAGVGMAIMLILLLDGLWAGIKANITIYKDNVGADLYVAQPGTRTFRGHQRHPRQHRRHGSHRPRCRLRGPGAGLLLDRGTAQPQGAHLRHRLGSR
jgi:hypothetical protein